MSESMLHLTPERFEAFLDGTLPDADRVVLESHVQACVRCQGELEDWRLLFAALADLPRLQPRPGFADRVLAGVRVRQPWYARAAEWAARLLPQTTRGWALVTAMLALPTVTVGAGAYWLLSQPWLTAEGLWLFAQQRAGQAVVWVGAQLGTALLDTAAVGWAVAQGQLLVVQLGAGGLGAAAALFGTLTAASGWVLYTNLFRLRTPSRDSRYVSYCF